MITNPKMFLRFVQFARIYGTDMVQCTGSYTCNLRTITSLTTASYKSLLF